MAGRPIDHPGETSTTVGFAIYTDITELKERERELERYERLVEASGDPVYTLDADGRFPYVNDALVEFTGYSEAEFLGAHASLAMTDPDLERGEETIRRLLQTDADRGTFEMDVVTTTGVRIPCEDHIALFPYDEEFRGTVGVLRDISARVQRKEQLERERDRLDEFAIVLSHDLRNPLNVARGHLDLARKDCNSDHLATVARAHDRMETMIEDVLSLARAGVSVGDPEPVAFEELLNDCWTAVATDTARLVVGVEGIVSADRGRLRELFENMFRNAIEHGGEDVIVEVWALDDGFYVADDGPGIPPDRRDRVFEHGYSAAEDGTGFGLAIVNDIAGAHGWTVSVAESETGGARFEFTGVELDDAG